MTMATLSADYKTRLIKKHFPKLSSTDDAHIDEDGRLYLVMGEMGGCVISHCEENEGCETFALGYYPPKSAVWTWAEQIRIREGIDFEMWALEVIS